MRTGLRPLLVLAALSAATPVRATPPPFDFTGTWTGTLTARGLDIVDMDATFTSTGPRTFTGSLRFLPTAPATGATCEVNGTYGGRVKLDMTCDHPADETGKLILRAHLNRAAAKLRTHVHVVDIKAPGRGSARGTLTLTKSPAESN
jgi:hypothetical protein